MTKTTFECQHLVKAFEGRKVINDLSASFVSGRITALIGPNGAGKTTLFHLMSGALHPDEGEILLRGQRIDSLSDWRIARKGIGRLFQDVRLFGRLTVLENVLVAFPHQIAENPIACLLKRSISRRDEAYNKEVARHLLNTVGLSDNETAMSATLSYGQQKLLGVARLLASGANVLMLDEPTSGVNPETIHLLMTLIRRLAAEGKTILIIEHNMQVVQELADWASFIDNGQVIVEGTPDTILSDDRVQATYLGM